MSAVAVAFMKDGSCDVIQIDVTNEQTRVRVDESRLGAAVAAILSDHGVLRGTVSVAIVDDATIHELNRRHLAHDYPTDVLSFLLEKDDEGIDAEIVVSAEMAKSRAAEFHWKHDDELLLYVIHGALHLVGYDDGSGESIAEIRREEARYMEAFGSAARPDAMAAGVRTVAGARRELEEGSAS